MIFRIILQFFQLLILTIPESLFVSDSLTIVQVIVFDSFRSVAYSNHPEKLLYSFESLFLTILECLQLLFLTIVEFSSHCFFETALPSSKTFSLTVFELFLIVIILRSFYILLPIIVPDDSRVFRVIVLEDFRVCRDYC